MKRFLIILLTAAALNSVAAAVCNKTTVADTVYYGTGDVLSGTIKITNPMTITGADGCVVPANTVQTASVVAGAFSIALIPNAGSTPTGTYYKATYNVSGTPFTETWTVPASGPQTLSGVRALTPPVPTVMIAASQLNPPSPCASNQVMTWNGTSWTCATPSAGGVTSVFGRSGVVVSASNDYNFNQLAGAWTKTQAPASNVYTDQANTYTAGMKQIFGASATTAGEGFSGVSADPSGAVAGDRWYRTDLNRMRIFTTASHSVMFTDDTLPTSQLSGTVTNAQLASSYSGVGSCGANNWASTLNGNAAPTCTQPGFSNLSGSIAIGQTPLTTRGDLMTVNSGGALARMAIGGANTLLHGGTDPGYSAVAIGDVTGSSGTGNFLFATSPTATNATVNQAADGNNLLFGQRFTDTSPTGNLIYFKNAANNADLFKLDVAGQMFHSNHDLFATDNNFDIGASGANRPRSIYVGTTLFLAAGSSGTPALSFGANGSFYSSGSNSLTFASGGADRFAIGSFGAWLRSNTTGFGYSSVDTTGSFDTALKYGGAAQTWQFALAPNGTPKAYTVQFGESSRNGTDSNIAGGDATIRAGAGTGTGGGGAWHIQTAPTGSTGTTQNTFGDVLTISANQHVKFASNAAPSITAGCGTSPSVAGSDNVMQVNVGTGGTATTCTVTFAKAYVAAPLCFANDEGRTTPITRAVGSTTTVVIDTSSAWTASSKIDVACYGN